MRKEEGRKGGREGGREGGRAYIAGGLEEGLRDFGALARE
jgi:hypothetical protein